MTDFELDILKEMTRETLRLAGTRKPWDYSYLRELDTALDCYRASREIPDIVIHVTIEDVCQ